jgi:hypothetical protein
LWACLFDLAVAVVFNLGLALELARVLELGLAGYTDFPGFLTTILILPPGIWLRIRLLLRVGVSVGVAAGRRIGVFGALAGFLTILGVDRDRG